MVADVKPTPGANAVPIGLSPALPVQQYAVTVQDSLRLSNCITENSALFYFKKTVRQVTAQSIVFELETVDFSQTAGHELGPLEEEMVRLKELLLLEIDFNGRLLQVVNKEELRRKWAAIQPVFKARYSHSPAINPAQVEQIGLILNGDGYLESVLAKSPAYSILFPTVYGRLYTAAAPHRSCTAIPRFIGELELPLLLETRLEDHPVLGGLSKVVVDGFVDHANYPGEEAQQALRKLTDKFDLDTSLLALHQESYSFDESPLQKLLEATRYTRYEVPGVFGKELVVLAQLLTD